MIPILSERGHVRRRGQQRRRRLRRRHHRRRGHQHLRVAARAAPPPHGPRGRGGRRRRHLRTLGRLQGVGRAQVEVGEVSTLMSTVTIAIQSFENKFFSK